MKKIRERALKIILVLVGLFFTAAAYPAIMGLHNPVNSDTGDTMQMAIYATLGIFLLIAARNPAAHRSLIAFAAWSSFAHAAIMGTLGFEIPELRAGFLIASGILVVIGVVLVALAPPKSVAQASLSGGKPLTDADIIGFVFPDPRKSALFRGKLLVFRSP